MDKPIILLRQTLEWEHNSPTYRLIAKPSQFGFGGIDYITEKLDGQDAMGIEIWIPTESTEMSLVIAAIGQKLLDNY